MGLLKLFSGPTPEKLEQKGDALFAAQLWGKAKLEYEHALDKLEKSTPQNQKQQEQLQNKIIQAKEALALEHQQHAAEMMTADCYEEAREMVSLALELSADPDLRQNLTDQLKEIDDQRGDPFQPHPFYADDDSNAGEVIEDTPDDQTGEDEEEHFRALCHTLPQEVQDAYENYGQAFQSGYIALNQGDFENAARYLAQAMEENPDTISYIPLELATAYLNLNRLSEAQKLLEPFLETHPEALPAYELMCVIFWEQRLFDQAQALLASIPADLAESLAVYILKGETFFNAGEYGAAKELYLNFMQIYGWNDAIARSLAKTHEALNESDNALKIYQEIMNQCTGCHAPIDPMTKQKYADLCFASGMHDTKILELYLSLAREVPEKSSEYFTKISQIYLAQGNQQEARRFQSLIRK